MEAENTTVSRALSRRAFLHRSAAAGAAVALAGAVGAVRFSPRARAAATVTANRSGSWSDPSTWSGGQPGGNDVIVPVGVTVDLTEDASARSIAVAGTLRATSRGYRDAWSKLHETAAAGATSAYVMDAAGWQPGDEIVFTPTSRLIAQVELRTISEVGTHQDHPGMVHVHFTTPLQYTHEVVGAGEGDPQHADHGGTIRYAGEVVNVTRPITLAVADGFTVTGSLELEDVAVTGSRIMWNNSTTGGTCRRIVVRGTVGGCFQTENTQNLLWEECVAYDSLADPSGGAGFGWCEKNGKSGPNGSSNPGRADGVYAVRCIAVGLRSPGGSLQNGRPYGFYFAGLGAHDQPTGTAGALGCIAAGVAGDGFHWRESSTAGLQHFWRNDAHSCATGMFIDGNRYIVQPNGQPYVTIFVWRNVHDGLFWGSYANALELHHLHALGNGDANVKVLNSDAYWSRFVCDGEGVTRQGVHVISYVTPPKRHAIYARTKFRNHTETHFSVAPTDTVGSNRFIDLPLASFETTDVARTDFCAYANDAIQQDQGFITGPDVLRFSDQTLRFGGCAAEPAVAPVPWVIPTFSATSPERTIQAPGSVFLFKAQRERVDAQPDPLVRPIEDWSMATELRTVAKPAAGGGTTTTLPASTTTQAPGTSTATTQPATSTSTATTVAPSSTTSTQPPTTTTTQPPTTTTTQPPTTTTTVPTDSTPPTIQYQGLERRMRPGVHRVTVATQDASGPVQIVVKVDGIVRAGGEGRVAFRWKAAPGEHTFEAVATDRRGNVGSERRNVKVAAASKVRLASSATSG